MLARILNWRIQPVPLAPDRAMMFNRSSELEPALLYEVPRKAWGAAATLVTEAHRHLKLKAALDKHLATFKTYAPRVPMK